MLGRFVPKFVFAVGCLTLLAIIYIASFYAVRNKLILPFERAEFGNVHTLRPVYNRVYYPLRYFTANGSSFARDYPEEYRGHLEKKPQLEDKNSNHRSANIDRFEGNFTMIGFVGRTETIKAYDEIEDGSFTKLIFGRALSTEHDRFINKLVESEVIELMTDPRIKKSDYSQAETDKIMTDYKILVNQGKDCGEPFVETYKERVLLHCRQTGYAQNIGGGCYHIIGYSLHTAVFEEAVKACSK